MTGGKADPFELFLLLTSITGVKEKTVHFTKRMKMKKLSKAFTVFPLLKRKMTNGGHLELTTGRKVQMFQFFNVTHIQTNNK